ncbi:MAG: hypothetical protein E6Q97_28705 [Desulfurellales bacterium]|nr:MAG: hypothetical protein E6Q97_28705 [Desulfurellales bacterium]
MAIIYSLICFGGRTGKTVTFTVSGSVVNLTNHGLRDGKGVAFTSTGTLPTGLTAGTIYYVRSTGLNTFTLHSTQADAISNTGQVTFTTTGSGTRSVKGEYFLSLTPAQLARYGAAGSERIYDGLRSWHIARNSLCTEYDEEWAEIGEAFTEVNTLTMVLSMQSARNVITPTIDGVVTEAFHAGKYLSGYIKHHDNSAGSNISVSSYRAIIEGITLLSPLSSTHAISTANGSSVDRCFVVGGFPGPSTSIGILSGNTLSYVTNNVVVGFAEGVRFQQYGYGLIFANNLMTKNTRGVYTISGTTSQIFGYFYNNISVGNTTSNWHTQSGQIERATNNAGASGDTIWTKSGGTSLICSTADFVDWGNNDFRLVGGSGLIDSGAAFFGFPTQDVARNERPAYAGGGAEQIDVGPFEKDLGFGPRPASHTLTLRNVAIGSRILIESQDGGTVHYNALASSSEVVATITVYGDARDQWVIKVRKASESPFYIPWSTLTTVTAGESSIYVSQTPDE